MLVVAELERIYHVNEHKPGPTVYTEIAECDDHGTVAVRCLVPGCGWTFGPDVWRD